MEISRLQDSIKIKTKTVSLVVEPHGINDAEVEIFTEDSSKFFQKNDGEKLIIKGPGDYEIKGVAISGERKGDDVIYRINDGQYTIILASLSAVSKIEIEDDESIGAVVLKLNSKFDEGAVAPLSSSLILLYGDEANAPQNNTSKREKVNLRKKDELDSSLVFLSR